MSVQNIVRRGHMWFFVLKDFHEWCLDSSMYTLQSSRVDYVASAQISETCTPNFSECVYWKPIYFHVICDLSSFRTEERVNFYEEQI